uniref:hypothetical protein n=1 Tax=Pseudonocardia nigra TaxID=1921578 RepID=UPI001C603AD8
TRAPSRALLDPAAYLDAPKNSRRANEEKINYNNRGLTGPAPSGTLQYGVVGEGPQRLLHLSTFGSDDRVSDRKSSQSLQLNIEQARQLVEIIEMVFPEMRR